MTEARTLQAIADFVYGRTDDVSIGVSRLIWPLSMCAECGNIEDHGQGVMCTCWSLVTPEDADALSDMGVEDRTDEFPFEG